MDPTSALHRLPALCDKSPRALCPSLTPARVSGPKTLCNACGVKRVRQLRSTGELKRRTPKAQQQQHAPPPPVATPQIPLPSSSDAEPELSASAEPSLATPKAQEVAAAAAKRPVRRAAARAAERTAEFAHRGEWAFPQEGTGEVMAQSYESSEQPAQSVRCDLSSPLCPHYCALQRFANPGQILLLCMTCTDLFFTFAWFAQDVSHPCSDVAEEISYSPALPFQDALTCAADTGMDEASMAAVNLLSISCRDLAESMAALPLLDVSSSTSPFDFRQVSLCHKDQTVRTLALSKNGLVHRTNVFHAQMRFCAQLGPCCVLCR